MHNHVMTLTIVDVLHVKMNAGHKNTHGLWTLVAQKFHHLKDDDTKRCEQQNLYQARENNDGKVLNARLITNLRQKAKKPIPLCLFPSVGGKPEIIHH